MAPALTAIGDQAQGDQLGFGGALDVGGLMLPTAGVVMLSAALHAAAVPGDAQEDRVAVLLERVEIAGGVHAQLGRSAGDRDGYAGRLLDEWPAPFASLVLRARKLCPPQTTIT